MRIMIVGAGKTGAKVLRQLQKNPAFTLITVDPSQRPFAVREGIIDEVDILEVLTPLTLQYVIDQAQPDLILLTASSEDLGLGRVAGLDLLAASVRTEIAAASKVPVITVARDG
jgi:FlaA1/EpsC-like NDP-sugar epimerase